MRCASATAGTTRRRPCHDRTPRRRLRGNGMKKALGVLFALPVLAFAGEGIVPESELSLGGVAIGDTSRAVIARLGKPARKIEKSGYLDLHYDYPNLRVSFSEGVAAGLHSSRSGGCTPKRLCPGDS